MYTRQTGWIYHRRRWRRTIIGHWVMNNEAEFLWKIHAMEHAACFCWGNGSWLYMGRRAFNKRCNEARHIYGLKCLGITNTALFREITGQMEDWRIIWWDYRRRRCDDLGGRVHAAASDQVKASVLKHDSNHSDDEDSVTEEGFDTYE
jgi:hypothetical protein